jgi:2-keto-4-pentenoate hydratase/2-oxohepta-3-ene-1,7-dioic acid hydratase in catechol pathway
MGMGSRRRGRAWRVARMAVRVAGLGVTAAILATIEACGPVTHNPRREAPCSPLPAPPRLIRYLSPRDGGRAAPVWGLVLEDIGGIPTRILNLTRWARDDGSPGARAADTPAGAAADPTPLFSREFALARERWEQYGLARRKGTLAQDARWERYTDVIAPEDLPRAICAPVPLGQAELDGERKVVVAVGLNFREHAEEAGGGDLFLFPKPVRPTGPYRTVHPAGDVELLDYELELGFVVLQDIDLSRLPTAAQLDGLVAYFVTNDVTDRAPIIRRSSWVGPGTGFVEAKAQPGFLPLGPWMVLGEDLRLLSSDCPRSLHMTLTVREGEHATLRQDSETARMVRDPRAILEALAARVDAGVAGGTRTEMSVERGGRERYYPLALASDGRAVLPKGSIVLTGTPGGTAMHAPGTFGLLGRSLRHFRSPTSQLLAEQRAHRTEDGYLADGDAVVAQIDQLGTQWWKVSWEDAAPGPDPCETADQ